MTLTKIDKLLSKIEANYQMHKGNNSSIEYKLYLLFIKALKISKKSHDWVEKILEIIEKKSEEIYNKA